MHQMEHKDLFLHNSLGMQPLAAAVETHYSHVLPSCKGSPPASLCYMMTSWSLDDACWILTRLWIGFAIVEPMLFCKITIAASMNRLFRHFTCLVNFKKICYKLHNICVLSGFLSPLELMRKLLGYFKHLKTFLKIFRFLLEQMCPKH